MDLSDNELNTVLSRLTSARLALQLVERQSGLPAQVSSMMATASRSLDDLVPLLTRTRPQAPPMRSPAPAASAPWPIRLGRSVLRLAARPARALVGTVCIRTTQVLNRV